MASVLKQIKDSKSPLKDTDRTVLLEGQKNIPGSSSSSSVGVISTEDKVEPLDSSPGKVSPTPSAAETVVAEQRTRLPIPTLDELVRSVVNPKDYPVLSRSASYGAPLQPKVTTQAPRAGTVVHHSEPLIENAEIEDSSQYLGSDEPANVDFTSRQNSDEDRPLVPELRLSLMQRYVVCSKRVADSFYIVPFLVVLFASGCFAFYMGIAYFHQCDLLDNLPILLVFMAASIILGTTSRIVYVLTKERWLARFGSCRFATFSAIGTFLMCYIVESLYFIFNKGYPSTEKGPGYCDPLFYDYVYWYNWALLGITVILAVVHGPNSTSFAGLL